MQWHPSFLRGIALVLAALLQAACSSYSGPELRPGVDDIDAVRAQMGEPALQWDNPDGGKQLAYPRGPAGAHTYMVSIGPDGVLSHIENVLDMAHFARIQAEMDMDAVLRLLGPPVPQWTAYFKARDELVWEWLFCDDFGFLARFDVLFDGSSRLVRSTYARPDLRGRDGVAPRCSH